MGWWRGGSCSTKAGVKRNFFNDWILAADLRTLLDLREK
jgi:hypothetical protein